jgi:hypothetical protein
MADGATRQSVLQSFAGSEEFRNRGLSDSETVSALFMASVLREPTEDELTRFSRTLSASGIDMTVVLLADEYDMVR